MRVTIILTKAHRAAVSKIQGVYCGLNTASVVFLIFYTSILVCFFLFAPFSEESEVFVSKYSQTAIQHAAFFRRVVNR